MEFLLIQMKNGNRERVRRSVRWRKKKVRESREERTLVGEVICREEKREKKQSVRKRERKGNVRKSR